MHNSNSVSTQSMPPTCLPFHMLTVLALMYDQSLLVAVKPAWGGREVEETCPLASILLHMIAGYFFSCLQHHLVADYALFSATA